MDVAFQAILDLLNSLIPSGASIYGEVATLNEILAYALVLGIIWSFFLRPLLKLLRLSK
jgi:hypothetical protein